jgi:hypothetical protein
LLGQADADCRTPFPMAAAGGRERNYSFPHEVSFKTLTNHRQIYLSSLLIFFLCGMASLIRVKLSFTAASVAYLLEQFRNRFSMNMGRRLEVSPADREARDDLDKFVQEMIVENSSGK